MVVLIYHQARFLSFIRILYFARTLWRKLPILPLYKRLIDCLELPALLIIIFRPLCVSRTEETIKAFIQRCIPIYMFLMCVCVYYIGNEGKFHQHGRFGTIIYATTVSKIEFRPPLFSVPDTKYRYHNIFLLYECWYIVDF